MIPDKTRKMIGQLLRTSLDKACPAGKITSLGYGIIGQGKGVRIIMEISKITKKDKLQVLVI